MAHSNQVREFALSGRGLELRPVYIGREGFLTGSARLAQEARDRAEAVGQEQELERRGARWRGGAGNSSGSSKNCVRNLRMRSVSGIF
jgi:hypothetical protein